MRIRWFAINHDSGESPCSARRTRSSRPRCNWSRIRSKLCFPLLLLPPQSPRPLRHLRRRRPPPLRLPSMTQISCSSTPCLPWSITDSPRSTRSPLSLPSFPIHPCASPRSALRPQSSVLFSHFLLIEDHRGRLQSNCLSFAVSTVVVATCAQSVGF